MQGYDTGTFTLEVEELIGDEVQTFSTWQDMPVIPDTEVTIDQSGDFSTLSPLSIDRNGDGIVDYEIAPAAGEIINLPKVPLTVTPDNKTILLGDPIPELTVSFAGFIAGDTAESSDITGAPNCLITTQNIIGEMTIECSIGTLASKTYDFQFIPGTLTVQYRWDGFLQPINDTAHQSDLSASVFKAGSTVPVKFQLKNAGGSILQAAVEPEWIDPEQVGPMSAVVGESTYSDLASAGNSYKWDSIAQQYVYNWNTKGLAPGYWYRIFAQLDDGTIKSVTIGLR